MKDKLLVALILEHLLAALVRWTARDGGIGGRLGEQEQVLVYGDGFLERVAEVDLDGDFELALSISVRYVDYSWGIGISFAYPTGLLDLVRRLGHHFRAYQDTMNTLSKPNDDKKQNKRHTPLRLSE